MISILQLEGYILQVRWNVTLSVKISQMSPNALLSNEQFNVENIFLNIFFLFFLFKIYICMVNL